MKSTCRINPRVSQELVGQGTQCLLELFPDSVDTGVPKCILNHDVIKIDDKKLMDVAKRPVLQTFEEPDGSRRYVREL